MKTIVNMVLQHKKMQGDSVRLNTSLQGVTPCKVKRAEVGPGMAEDRASARDVFNFFVDTKGAGFGDRTQGSAAGIDMRPRKK